MNDTLMKPRLQIVKEVCGGMTFSYQQGFQESMVDTMAEVDVSYVYISM